MSELISIKHQTLYRQYYADTPISPGVNRWSKEIAKLSRKVEAKSILDYGCGAGARLADSLPELSVASYDPGIPEYSTLPEPADLVVCLDVLEHVEPSKVDAVIDHLFSLANKAVFLTVSCQESESKTLPDGSPWHSFVRSPSYWRGRLPMFRPRPTDRLEFVGIYEVP